MNSVKLTKAMRRRGDKEALLGALIWMKAHGGRDFSPVIRKHFRIVVDDLILKVSALKVEDADGEQEVGQ